MIEKGDEGGIQYSSMQKHLGCEVGPRTRQPPLLSQLVSFDQTQLGPPKNKTSPNLPLLPLPPFFHPPTCPGCGGSPHPSPCPRPLLPATDRHLHRPNRPLRAVDRAPPRGGSPTRTESTSSPPEKVKATMLDV